MLPCWIARWKSRIVFAALKRAGVAPEPLNVRGPGQSPGGLGDSGPRPSRSDVRCPRPHEPRGGRRGSNARRGGSSQGLPPLLLRGRFKAPLEPPALHYITPEIGQRDGEDPLERRGRKRLRCVQEKPQTSEAVWSGSSASMTACAGVSEGRPSNRATADEGMRGSTNEVSPRPIGGATASPDVMTRIAIAVGQ
jgi:hypothetical protein